MYNEPTDEKLRELRLDAMADAWAESRRDPAFGERSFDERLAHLVERQWLFQRNQVLNRRLKYARIKQDASIEGINFQHPRELKRGVIEQLALPEWIRQGRHCLITGPTGVGKSWLACALAQKACRNGFRSLYIPAAKLFRELLSAQADGTFTSLIRKLCRPQLLVVDDWGMPVLKRHQYRDFLELLDERQGRGSMLLTSQYPAGKWHELIGDETVADAILDRLVHKAYKLELEGESMR